MKKFLSLVLALVMTMSLVTVSAGAKDFTDDSKITYKEAVDVMSAIGVIDGYADGSFNPTATLSRGAAAKIICNLILGPTTASALAANVAPFADVPANSTFAGYIAYCQKEGIIGGYSDGTFRPGNTLTGYAFMKMLLGALGYDADIEGYNEANYGVSVAKRAIGIGLDDGLTSALNGTRAVTREEACLYALNTLKATMVDYDAKTNVSVGGATVIVGGSNAKDVANTGKTDGNIGKSDDKMQFAERYFTDLKCDSDTDAFYRPATTWKLKNAKIGTYTDTPDATYTASVKSKTIYTDLGLTDAIAASDVDVYVDGASAAGFVLQKGNKNEIGGNGILTEVFYDSDSETAVITEITTYFGEIASVHEAKASKDAYVVVNGLSENANTIMGSYDEFETEAFEEDDYVLFTFSQKENEIQSLAAAESVNGIVDEVVNKKATDDANKSVTVDGTKYKASADFKVSLLNSISVEGEYTVYMDAYGYAIHAIEEEYVSEDYALVWDIRSSDLGLGAFGSHEDEAILVFADGKVKTVDLAKDYLGKSLVATKNIVTFKTNEDGEYVLKAVATAKQTTETDSTSFSMAQSKSKVTFATGTDKYTNSKTVVVLKDGDSFDWKAYTGTKNMPSVAATADVDVDVYAYCKNNNMVTVMFVVPAANSIVSKVNDDIVFVAGGSGSHYIHNKLGDYYTYNAVVDGEITQIKVDGTVIGASGLDGFYNNHTVDDDGLYDGITFTTDGRYHTGTGIDKTSEEYTVTINKIDGVAGTSDTLTIASDAKIYLVNDDDEISASTYAQIKRDSDDAIYYHLDTDDVIDYLVIVKQDQTTLPNVGGGKHVTGTKTTLLSTASDIKNFAADGAYTFAADSAVVTGNQFDGLKADTAADIIVFKYTCDTNSSNVMLTIKNEDGDTVYYETATGVSAGGHCMWVNTAPYTHGNYNGGNDGFGYMKDKDLPAGEYDWTIAVNGTEVVSGSFGISK